MADERYLYQISVFTGMRGSAGTRSRVSLVVSGDRDDTGVRRLTDGRTQVRRLVAGDSSTYAHRLGDGRQETPIDPHW